MADCVRKDQTSFSYTSNSNPNTQRVASSPIQLREYQYSSIQQVFSAWKAGHKDVLLQLPTGGGKTLIFSEVARQFAVASRNVLVLVHREELLKQAATKLQQICPVKVGAIKSGYNYDPTAPIQVASVQTLVRRSVDLDQFGLVIIDEAHHACSNSYQMILDAMPHAYQLGVTATPQRLDGKGLGERFQHLIQGVSVAELIDSGYLSKYKMFAPASVISTDGVKSTAGDYNSKQLRKAAMNAAVMGAVVPSWKEFADGRSTIVFAVDVEHSKSVTQSYLDAGIKAAHLDGKTPADVRADVISRFAKGEITVLVNCDLFAEGFDVPGVDCVQILRPTQSLGLYLQQLGRGLRIAEGKDHAIFLDHTQNWMLHGMPDEDREWTLDGLTKKKRQRFERSGDGEIKLSEEKEERLIDADESVKLAEVVNGGADPEILAELDRLIEIQTRKGYKAGWVAHRLFDLKPGLPELRIAARRLGYKPSWVHFAIKTVNGGVA